MKRGRRLPPQRRCQICGGICYAWAELAVCNRADCRETVREERAALRESLGARFERREPAAPEPGAVLHDDGIPY